MDDLSLSINQEKKIFFVFNDSRIEENKKLSEELCLIDFLEAIDG